MLAGDGAEGGAAELGTILADAVVASNEHFISFWPR
jgi:hypothetical protein